jgi:uncharacterized protein YfaP (DUF2135 family)
MAKRYRKKLSLFACAMALSAVCVGCSMFSSSDVPIDCDLVRTQRNAGQTDAQIAANLSYPQDKVAACQGGPKSANKSEQNVPSNY